MSWHDNRCRYGIFGLSDLVVQNANGALFFAHGGSRLGGTDKDIQQLQPQANVKNGFEAYLHKTVRAEQQVEKRLAKFLTENGYTK